MSHVTPTRRGLAVGFAALAAVTIMATATPAIAQTIADDHLVVDSAYDPAFLDTYFGAPAQVDSLIKLRGGSVLAGGRFNQVDGESRTGVVRLLADGTVDPSFATTGTGLVPPAIDSMAVQPDGKIVIGGVFESYNGAPVGDIVRLNEDGSLDPSFVPAELGNRINALAVQDDGKILAGVARSTVVRLNADGSRDESYLTTMTPQVGVFEIVPQDDGDIMIAGAWDFLNGEEWRFGLARLNSDGSTDASFNPRQDVSAGYVADIDVDRSGGVIAGGTMTIAGSGERRYLASFSSTGELVEGVGTTAMPDSTVLSVSRLPKGKIVIGGAFEAVGDSTRGNVARLRKHGGLDKSVLGTGAEDGQVWSTVTTRGRVVVGGNFATFDGFDRLGLVQLVRAAR